MVQNPHTKSQWSCPECGERPWMDDIDENGADMCPECGADVTAHDE